MVGLYAGGLKHHELETSRVNLPSGATKKKNSRKSIKQIIFILINRAEHTLSLSFFLKIIQHMDQTLDLETVNFNICPF